MMSDMKAAILYALQYHVGEKNAIQAEKLRLRLGMEGIHVALWEVRDAIHEMRNDGHLIASGQRGYFIPETRQEAFKYIDQVFRVPARDVLTTARKQRQAAIHYFGGQMRFV